MKNVKQFSEQLQEKINEYFQKKYDFLKPDKVKIVPGKKYIKIDVGSSGKFMFDTEDGHLYGIKGYGVINRKHNYGYLPAILQKGFLYDGYNIRIKA